MFKLNSGTLLSSSTSIEETTTTTLGIGDEISTIANTISEHGPVIVICAVFIFIFILIFLLFLKINTAMINNIMKQLTTKNTESSDITQKLLDHFLDEVEDDEDKGDKNKDEDKKEKQSENKQEHRKDLVGMYIDYNVTFKSASKVVLNKIRCDRVAVYVFHNGNKSLFGFPFIKMSCVHEQTMRGDMTVRGKNHSNLPLHHFNDFIEKLYNNKEYAGNIDNVEIQDNSVREFLTYSEAESLYSEAITNEDGTLAGFVVCEFNQKIDFADEYKYKEIKYAVHDMITSIHYIITNEEFIKKYEDDKSEEN